MQVNINNKTTDVQATNVQELSDELALPQKGVAIAIDNKIVPRADWVTTFLIEGANIVVIKAAFGG